VLLSRDENLRVLSATCYSLPDEKNDDPEQAQKSKVGGEDIAEGQTFFSQTGLHSGSSDFSSKL
jgi:hypothetical protein